MTTADGIPYPPLTPTGRTREWWDSAALGVLLLQKCADCGAVQHYPRVLCIACWSEELSWVESGGAGRVWAFTVVHMPGHPWWKTEVPYTIAVVELDEGPRVMTRIVEVAPSRVRIGDKVQLVPVAVADLGTALPMFHPAEST